MVPSVLLLAALGSYVLCEDSVQYPELTSCSDIDQITISDMAIENAIIGEVLEASFTLTVNKELKSDPTLHLTITPENGKKIPCFGFIGSCSYKMCGGKGPVEQLLGEQWNNTCPVPAMTAEENIDLPLPELVEQFIGEPPTTITMTLNVTEGGSSVGCVSFSVDIEPADETEGDEEE